MGRKQKGGILPFLMLMNAMKGGGMKKRKRTKRQKQKGGLYVKEKQRGGFFFDLPSSYKSGKVPKNRSYYKPFGIG